MKRILSLFIASVMLMLSFGSITVSAEQNGSYSAEALCAKTENGYTVSGIYNYPETCDAALLAILAVYESNLPKTVKLEEIGTDSAGTAFTIDGISANEGNVVKAMLWEKDTMKPLTDAAEITVVSETTAPTTEVTAAPTTEATTAPTTEATTAPTAEVTAEPTPTPTSAVITVPTATPTAESVTSDHWDFAAYAGDSAVTATTETTVNYAYTTGGEELEIHLNSGDTITDEGLYWSVPGGTKSDAVTTVTNNRYIKYTPASDGTLSITFKGAVNASKKHPRLYVSCGNDLSCTTKDANDSQLEANQLYDNNSTDFAAAEFTVNKGKTYFIWCYYYNSTSNQFTLSDIAFTPAETTVRTRNIYTSNMLLQRNVPIVIDGKASAADSVTVTLTDETTAKTVQTVTDSELEGDGSWADKDWSVALDAVSDYSDTYSISVTADGAETVKYTNVIFGDLYLFTGQSNMWKQVSYYKNIDSAAYGTSAVEANATDKIRVMHTQGSGDTGTAVLQYDAVNRQEWRDFSTYANVSDISAPAYTAAVKMYQETGVPIGLITNAYPGSYISSWFDSALAIDNCNLGKNGNSNERNWYCGRIYPLRNLKLSGIFWYQGEADAATTYHDEPYTYYSEMLPKLIDSWRTLFNDSDLPFYYVQLSRIGSTIVDENNPDTGAAGKMPIKKAQTDVYLSMTDKTNVGVISTLDLYGNHDASGTANCRTDIHLGQKNIVGERMANLALADIYGKDTYRMGPIYKSSVVDGNSIVVTFDCNGELKIMPSSQYTDSTGEEKITNGEFDPDVLNEFEIYGTKDVDGTATDGWYSASAVINENDKTQVIVTADGVTNPTKVRYCGSDYPESPNLTDDSGLPSYVFEKTAETTTSPTTEATATPTATATITPSPTPTSAVVTVPTSPTVTPATSPEATDSPEATPEVEKTFKFDFGADSTAAEGYTAVTSDMVFDMASYSDEEEGYCGFLGTRDESYANDVLSYDCDNRAIDGFTLVKGQKIALTAGGTASDADADSDYIAVPAKADYIPADASEYEGRFPIRFSMKAEEGAYYIVTATVKNASDTEDACVSLFSEKRQIIAEDVTIPAGESITFKFSVDIENKVYKKFTENFTDDMLNIEVSGKNAAISSVVIDKLAKTDGTIKGETQFGGVNNGVTMWLCTDSTGCDYGASIPFFALQSYCGVGEALSKYMPEDIAVSNQGEGGLASGDAVHFNNCMLKQGDYLYVEYGHNESDTDSFVSNLEKYYTRAHESGAKLLVVSPINRHNSSVYSDGTWTSSFTAYITAGKEFVETKLADGADDIAYVDLNTPYVEWMNEETDRIVGINSDIARQSAMNFYYYSSKGTNVDAAHINDAGADNGAYCFFTAAKAIVDAADADGADDYTKTQAEVLRPIVEGMKTTVGDTAAANTPMQVSEDIIKAGVAPNSYWDTVPSEYFEYDNAAAVEAVDAVTNDDGSVTVKGVSVRVMNTLTYVKAVVAVSDNGTETKYYTESNYDFTGAESGTVLTNSGFITSDKNHNDVSSSDKVSEITVPTGKTCTVRIYECDELWVVGDNGAVSAAYAVYPETETIFDEDCSSTDGWEVLSGAATNTQTVTADGDNSYISIYSSCADSGNNKKNYGFYKALNKEMSTGVYRMSFKTRFGAGMARFALVSTIGTKSSPFSQKEYAFIIDNGSIYVNSSSNPIYTTTSDEGEKSAEINANQWINVDAIVDLNNGKLSISAAGSDYAEFDIESWQTNNTDTLPINYFGVAGSSDGTPITVDIDDIKITELKSDEVQKSITVSVNNDEYGSATASEDSVSVGASVTVTATANSGYMFTGWTDADGNTVSANETYTISRVYSDTALTASFEAVPENVIMWDFSEYSGDNAIDTTTAATDTSYEKSGETLEIHLGTGDSLTTSGIYWAVPGSVKSDETAVSNNRYIKYTPAESGTLTVAFQGSAYASSSKCPRMYITQGDDTSCMYKTNTHIAQKDASAKDTVATIEATLEKDTTYYIWAYYYNGKSVSFTVSDVTFTPSEG